MKLLYFICLLQGIVVLANVEKIIFLGPESIPIPAQHPNIDDLNLERVTPQRSTLRTQLLPQFPSEKSKHGSQSWFLVDGLKEGARYEIRICWAATQPTAFRLEVYDITTVFETPALITALAEYSESRQSEPPTTPDTTLASSQDSKNSSCLFLQIFAAADYYTTNSELMQNVPLVNVDIILDPYLFNAVPVSLIPTAAYIILIAVGSWFLSSYIYEYLRKIAREIEPIPEKKSL